MNNLYRFRDLNPLLNEQYQEKRYTISTFYIVIFFSDFDWHLVKSILHHAYTDHIKSIYAPALIDQTLLLKLRVFKDSYTVYAKRGYSDQTVRMCRIRRQLSKTDIADLHILP